MISIKFLSVFYFLFLSVLQAYTYMNTRVCLDESIRLEEDVMCKAKESVTFPCKISRIAKDNCYNIYEYNSCKKVSAPPYNESISDKGENYTDVTIFELKETTLPILITLKGPSSLWLLETNNSTEAEVKNLPGIISNITEMNCTGCPMPTFNWYPYRKYHKIIFEVIPDKKRDHLSVEEVVISLFASNDTEMNNEICLEKQGEAQHVVNGTVNTRLTVEGVYSKTFCIVLDIWYSEGDRYRFKCARNFSMLEVPNTFFRKEINAPASWTIFLVFVIIMLLAVAITPYAIHRGLLKVPCCRQARQKPLRNPVSNGNNANLEPAINPSGKEHFVNSKQSLPLLNSNTLRMDHVSSNGNVAEMNF